MFTCVMAVWFMKRGFMKNELTNNGTANGRVTPLIIFMLKYMTPLLIFYIFIKNFM